MNSTLRTDLIIFSLHSFIPNFVWKWGVYPVGQRNLWNIGLSFQYYTVLKPKSCIWTNVSYVKSAQRSLLLFPPLPIYWLTVFHGWMVLNFFQYYYPVVHMINNYMAEQSPWVTNSHSASLLWNTEVQYCVHKNQVQDSILSYQCYMHVWSVGIKISDTEI